MRTTLAALAVALLAGCGSTVTPTPTTTTSTAPVLLSAELGPKFAPLYDNPADCSPAGALSDECAAYLHQVFGVLDETAHALNNHPTPGRYAGTVAQVDHLFKLGDQYLDCREGKGLATACPGYAAQLSAAPVTVEAALLADEKG